MAQPVALFVRDDRALVGDHGRDDPGRLERPPDGLHHPPGDDDHGNPRLVGALHRRDRPGTKRHVGPHERAVEVGRDDANIAREIVGKLERGAQPFRLPPDFDTT